MAGAPATGCVVLLGAAAVLVWPGRADGWRRTCVLMVAGAHPGAQRGPVHQWVGVLRRRFGRLSRSSVDRSWLVSVTEGLAAGLQAGLPPARAVQLLAESSADGAGQANGDVHGLLTHLARLAESGGALAPAWRQAAGRMRSPDLSAVAEAWSLAERSGAPMVDVLEAMSVALRDRQRTAAAVEVALAAPRATARLLAVLPFGGLALGELVGVHPVATLATTVAGRVCAVAGLLLTLAGRWWMRRLVRSAVTA